MGKEKKGLNEFLKLCAICGSDQKLAQLFDLFLTDEERKALSLRYLIVRELLMNEHTQRDIAKRLNVSIAKITRGSNELKRMDKKFLTFLKQKLE